MITLAERRHAELNRLGLSVEGFERILQKAIRDHKLTEREGRVLARYFGLNGQLVQTALKIAESEAELAGKPSISEEYIRRVRKEALEKLGYSA